MKKALASVLAMMLIAAAGAGSALAAAPSFMEDSTPITKKTGNGKR